MYFIILFFVELNLFKLIIYYFKFGKVEDRDLYLLFFETIFLF